MWREFILKLFKEGNIYKYKYKHQYQYNYYCNQKKNAKSLLHISAYGKLNFLDTLFSIPISIRYVHSFSKQNESPNRTFSNMSNSSNVMENSTLNCPSQMPSSSSSSSISSTCSSPSSFKSKSKNELTLLCSTLDASGKLIRHSQPTSKSSLCSSTCLLPRDLRKLDGTLKNQLSAILVRPKGILINFDFIKAIIKGDSVILFESTDPLERIAQSSFLVELQTKLQSIKIDQKKLFNEFNNDSKKNKHKSTVDESNLPFETSDNSSLDSSVTLPFELVVLESILLRVCTSLQESLDELVPLIDQSLYSLREQFVHWNKLQILLESKRAVNSFKRRVEGLRHALAEILNSDDDMTAMYLSEKETTVNEQSPLVRTKEDHEEVELLLESYLKIIEEVLSRVEELSKNMQSTEDIVNIGLIGQRNELLLLELRLSIGTFAASIGALGASLFGMNLHTGYEHHPIAFYATTATLLSLSGMGLLWAARKLGRLVRKY